MYTGVSQSMSTKRVNFRIPEELLEKADAAAEVTHRNRTELVVAALQTYLDEIEDEEEYKASLVERYLDDDMEYELLEAVLGRQDAAAVRTSKALLEDGETFADDLAEL